MKNTRSGMQNRFDTNKEKTDELEDTVEETIDNERERKKMNKDKQGMDVLWNIFKRSNPHAIGVQEKKEWE